MTEIKVYILDKFPEEKNKYNTNRIENWEVRYDKSFSSLKEAKEYIKEKTRITVPEFTNLVFSSILPREQAEEIFFSDSTYLKYQRYFIGKPPISSIKQCLINSGIKVISN